MEPAPVWAAPAPRTLVLCFDGTGNKFSGTPADSNIVKIFSLLDRQDLNQFHYYQPGIGTYVESSSLARKSALGRLRSWWVKSKDQAIGTSFGEHVMAGYKFLMRYYNDGDHIYFFGFSRGAYTARFLAQMLDYIGLLTAGNEEMLRFAWKTFARWQMRTDDHTHGKNSKKEMYRFMKHFRETFCRPVEPLRFLGLFDCVNSVPQFEAAWMNRAKFPYTARSSARVIRHAVSIDERRAKFRQDLISSKMNDPADGRHIEGNGHSHNGHVDRIDGTHGDNGERPALHRPPTETMRFRSKHAHLQPLRTVRSGEDISIHDAASSIISLEHNPTLRTAQKNQTMQEQDILEIWFAGQHGDIGGGWDVPHGEQPVSDIPLIWMIREAHRAGLPFDNEELASHGLLDELRKSGAPQIEVDGLPVQKLQHTNSARMPLVGEEEDVFKLHTTSRVHDSLEFGGGMSWVGCLAWKVMEYIPFRRMDLQPDGSWKPISWPLPRGEVRDVPADAIIHGSVIRRMKTDSNYRPGNVIVGGGGRGVRRAPSEYGIGTWQVVREAGSHLGEAMVKIPHDDVNAGHEGEKS